MLSYSMSFALNLDLDSCTTMQKASTLNYDESVCLFCGAQNRFATYFYAAHHPFVGRQYKRSPLSVTAILLQRRRIHWKKKYLTINYSQALLNNIYPVLLQYEELGLGLPFF